jgi:hypothetical protein
MTRRTALRLAAVVCPLAALFACTGAAVVEGSATAVTVRYTSLEGIEAASRIAQKACAVHHKTARLRNTAEFGLSERYAHFDCV